MKKLWLIIRREYLIRVKKKSFILTTLLTPLGFGLLMAVSMYMGATSTQVDQAILVKDDSTIFQTADLDTSSLNFEFSNSSLDELKDSYDSLGYDMLVYIPDFNDLDKKAHDIRYYSEEKMGFIVIESIERKVEKAFKAHKIKNASVDQNVLEALNTKITLENGELIENPDGNQSGKLSMIVGSVLGGIMGFLMYIVIFVYGGMVMRSVMEEKINRIVEVMISAAKPFELMLGKVIGVGGVGLTQLAIWMLLIPAMMFGVQAVFGVSPQADQMQEIAGAAQQIDDFDINNVLKEIYNLNWWMILPVFILFFFGGYFIYSTLFAAIGSAIGDDMGEAQQLMMPIMIPVILAIIMLQPVISNPNSNMAVFGSLFPLFSPILMPARLAFDPPVWQIVLSIVLLFLTCILFAWVASRIYRIGILMYGKKVNLREVSKWLFYKM